MRVDQRSVQSDRRCKVAGSVTEGKASRAALAGCSLAPLAERLCTTKVTLKTAQSASNDRSFRKYRQQDVYGGRELRKTSAPAHVIRDLPHGEEVVRTLE